MAFPTPPLDSSILAYNPYFPNGIVNGVWAAWFQSITTMVDTGPVVSFNGRTGVVLPAANDYSFADLSGTATVAQIPNLPASQITSGQLALAQGGTGADLSATGGASQVLKQTSAGGAVTVGQLAASDITATAGTNAIFGSSVDVVQRGLDALVQSKVKSATTAAQPGSPSDGDTYLLPTSSTGAAWAGNDGKIARYSSVTSAWEFYTPQDGWETYAQDTGVYWFQVGGAWTTQLKVGNGTASTSTTTGDLVVTGGAGIGGAVNAASATVTGLSAAWGTTPSGGFQTIMGTSSATWLMYGTSGGVFRAGIQSLDSGGQSRFWTSATNWATISSGSGTTVNLANLGTVTANSFSGAGTGLTGTAASLTAGNATQLGSVAAASYALLASPTFTGTPTAPTATVGTNTTQLATTAFVLANGGSGGRLKRTVFTSSGSWTCPTGVTFADVTLTGGGGAGGDNDGVSNGGGGGGAGATLVERIPVTAGTQYDITIGAGGTISLGAAGNNGGDTTFATHLGATLATAKGGIGGGYGGAGGAGAASGSVDPQLGGAAGVLSATAGNANSLAYPLALRFGCFIPGGGGGDGGTASVASKIGGKCESYNGGSTTGNKLGGNGGASPWGPGGNGATVGAAAAAPAANTGVGGGGGSFATVARNPAAGASGYAIIDAIY